ncbi:MAG: citrate synthase, partial [Firmicutes bacterium]|nr:citrate synthase [Bacillota bacterium]
MYRKPKKLPEEFICEITPEIAKYTERCLQNSEIEEDLYTQYAVNRGLRDINGKGVLTGLTAISEINSFRNVDGKSVPIEGELFFRGVNVKDLVNGFASEHRFGFEETTYLLLHGKLPNREQLEEFCSMLASYRSLPPSFVRDFIMKAPSRDIMNALARGILTLYSYDMRANDTHIDNVYRQCIQLISMFPLISVYSYHALNHYHMGNSMIIHPPIPELSTAENILHMLRPDSRYSALEAEILDIALVLHAEHGGGNNSTFTTRVVSSSGTDTYSAIAAGLGSLKGPKHGGANIKVVQMFEDIKAHVPDFKDEEKLTSYLDDILNKRAFDHQGLVYGIGHAIYAISDPRAEIFRAYVQELAHEKGRMEEYQLYLDVERIAISLINKERQMHKGVSANIDFFSGFVYSMLDLPLELYTPIFAIARISGW